MTALLGLLRAGELRVYEIGHWPTPLYSVTVSARSEREARKYCGQTHGFSGPLCVDVTDVWIASLEAKKKGEASE